MVGRKQAEIFATEMSQFVHYKIKTMCNNVMDTQFVYVVRMICEF